MANRTVTIDLRELTDEPWGQGAKVTFFLVRNSFSASATYPKAGTEVAVDEDGRASVALWCNAEGVKESQYVCELPTGETFPFVLPDGDGAVAVEVLRGLSAVPYTASNAELFQGLVNVEAEARRAADALRVVTLAEDGPVTFGDATRVLVILDTAAGDVTAALPPAGGAEGREVFAKKVADDNLGILNGYDSELIDGQSVFNLEMNLQSVHLVAAGGGWYIVG